MRSRFRNYIDKHRLFTPADNILLAVSGGIDSSVMLHLFHVCGIKAAIAHCNFGLRGEQSVADETFVRELAGNYSMPFFVMHFNTSEYADLQKLSIQMAARELRYNWFENLRQQHGFQYIATAHNADDAIETFFINLLRGSGIQGLTGIKNKNGFLIRPLLFAFRSEIMEYCNAQKLAFRNDASNDTDAYLRNKIRHILIPVLSELNPEINPIMSDNLARLSDAEKVYSAYIKEARERVVTLKDDGTVYISIDRLNDCPAPKLLLFEILKNYGFSSATASEIYENLEGEAGSTYYSEEKRLIKDRNSLIITPAENTKDLKFYIEKGVPELLSPVHLKIQSLTAAGFSVTADKSVAALDENKLSFPLILRHWQKGDFFKPFGMEGFKKVSDFFVDSKVSIPEKENTWILTSGGEIVWILGMRLDDRFKITSKTENIVLLSILKD